MPYADTVTALELLAVDAGQTGIKLRLRRTDGTVLDDTLPGVLTDRALTPQLAAVVEHVSQTTGMIPPTVTFGVSGVTDPQAEAHSLAAHPALTGASRIVVAHDSTTSFLGALGDRSGAVIAVGTGVVTLGVGPARAVRVDGWGHIMGDAGSGYWIGREALDAVMRAHDGRGPATALTAVAQRHWPDLDTAYPQLQADPERVRVVASFARHTAELAADGDRVARGICDRAAAELAHSVLTALRTSDAPSDAHVAAIGGVLHAELIRAAFTEHVRAARPQAVFAHALGTGVDGAVALADLAHDHPLRTIVAEAGPPGSGIR